MQISALTDIVEGKLLNKPSISFITQIHTDLKKVNDGDAYFTDSQDDLDKAIIKGVFALIVDFTPKVCDKEIAWIKVDDLNKAKTNILRYQLLQKQIISIHINQIFHHLLTIFKT